MRRSYGKNLAVFMILFGMGGTLHAQTSLTVSRTGLTGYATTASPTLGIMDKSYATSPISPVLGHLRPHIVDSITLKKMLEYINRLRIKLPPSQMLALTGQTRLAGGPTIYAAEAMYSNYELGFDIGYQRIEGGLEGNGIGARFDLTSERADLARTLLGLQRRVYGFIKIAEDEAKKSPSGDVITGESLILIDDYRQGLYNGYSDLALKIEEYAFSLRWAIVGGMTRLREGRVSNAGVALSLLRPIGPDLNESLRSGLLYAASLQAVRVEDRDGFRKTDPRLSLVLAWQDKVPESTLLADSKWRVQTGMEVSFRNGLEDGNSYIGFLRLRPDNHTETVFLLGTRPNGRVFAGLRLTGFIAF